MLATNFRGPYRIRASQKPDPVIAHPGDAIVRVTRACICGSDLHLYPGLQPAARLVGQSGDQGYLRAQALPANAAASATCKP